MEINTLLNKFREFCTKHKYGLKSPTGLLSPVFPNEFNVSGGHNYSMEFLNSSTRIAPSVKYSLFERTFRRIDLERVGYSNHHLSFFQVALFAYTGDQELVGEFMQEGVTHMKSFITEALGIPKERLLITVFDGGKVKDFVIPKEPFLKQWLSAGFSQRQIIPIRGRRNLIFSEIEGAAVCPTCEIFFDKGETSREGDRFVEIGSLNLYKYLYSQRKNKLIIPDNWVLNSIVGIERLLMVLQDKWTIFNIDCIYPLITIIQRNFSNPLEIELYNSSVKIIADTIRSITFICADGVEIDSTPQGKILKKLIKQLVSQMRYLNILDIAPIEECIGQIAMSHKDLYPNLLKVKDKVIDLISMEIKTRMEHYR